MAGRYDCTVANTLGQQTASVVVDILHPAQCESSHYVINPVMFDEAMRSNIVKNRYA